MTLLILAALTPILMLPGLLALTLVIGAGLMRGAEPVRVTETARRARR